MRISQSSAEPGERIWAGAACRWLSACTAALALASVAIGQVRPVQTGRALDANRQLGSGGYNPARPVSSGLSGNLIISGNVTGGRAFRGFSPIRSTSELFVGVPSSSLSDFVRDSIGLPDVAAGQSAFTFRPFFFPSRTVASPAGPPPRPLFASGISSAARAQQLNALPRVTPLTATRQIGPVTAALPPDGQYWQPTGVGMFRPDIMTGLPRGLELVEARAVKAALPRPADTETAAESPEAPEQAAGQTAVPPESPLAQIAGQPPTTAHFAMERPAVQPVEPGAAAPPAAGGAEPDLLATMQQTAQWLRRGEISELPAATVRPEDDPRLQRQDLTEAQRQYLLTQIRREQASRLLQHRLERPIRTLVGSTHDARVDRLLAQAEQAMRDGKFYLAASSYAAVISLKPDNFLAWVGRANALLAAGEYLSAYLALERALERFPEILLFNFDLPALLGKPDVLDLRRAELDRILAGRDDYRLRFLLGYAEYFSGLKQTGMQILRHAAESAPPNSPVVKAFRALAARKGPATQPGG